MILAGPKTESIALPAPARSILATIYRVSGALALIVAILAIVFGILGDKSTITFGFCALGASILFFGLAEFFEQIARITAATEETARRLRDRPKMG